jgi:hypothetical protein
MKFVKHIEMYFLASSYVTRSQGRFDVCVPQLVSLLFNLFFNCFRQRIFIGLVLTCAHMHEIEMIVFRTKKTFQDEENDSRDKSFGTFSNGGKIAGCDENDWWKSLLVRCSIATKTEGLLS